MKSILFIACLVLVQGAPAPDAEPEADPYFYYNTGLNYPTTTYHNGGVHTAGVVPNAFSNVVSPFVPALPAVPATFAGAVHTPFVHQAVVKNVEVTPTEVVKEVTPLTHQTFVSPYNVGFGYGNYRLPYTTGAYHQYPVATYANTHLATAPLTTTHLATAAISPVATVSAVRDAASPSYVANSGGALHIVNKREADPEADADAAYHYYGYSGHHGHPYGYGHGYGYGYGHRTYGYGLRRAYSGYYGYPYAGYGSW